MTLMYTRNHRVTFSVLAICIGLAHVSAAQVSGDDYVASVTIEDLGGAVKTGLRRTTERRCETELRGMKKAMQAESGIVRIVSAKCAEMGMLAGYFQKWPMGVPYVTVGDDEIMILRGARESVCCKLADFMQTATGKSADCIFSN
jgi:hypothetical protein